MTVQITRIRYLPVLAACLLISALHATAFSADINSWSLFQDITREEALKLGEAMYRDGILPSGGKIRAVVEGDIPVEGSMFTCANCHMRGGLGSVEGTIITPPTNGDKLFRPKKRGQELTEAQRKTLPSHFQEPDSRPAYTDETLARLLRTGIDPSGRKLDPIMPLYQLDEKDLAILVFYLRNLSSTLSPGVTDTAISFATVVSDDIEAADRAAMLLPLEAYIRDRNVRAPYFRERSKNQAFAEEADMSYRQLSLATWELKGRPETWQAQLEKYYEQGPVFALLGGMVSGSWTPVHDFCEKNRIPCLFPLTDLPVVSDSHWYTLYYSKGPYQEGEAAARYVRSELFSGGDRPIVQIFRKNSAGLEMSRGFRDTGKKLGLPRVEEFWFDPGEAISDAFWKDLKTRRADSMLILWLGPEDLVRAGSSSSAPIIASSTIMGDGLYRLPEGMKARTHITYPFRLPQDSSRNLLVVRNWLKVRNIPDDRLLVSSRIYFMGKLLTDVFMHMQRNYYRDNFLDVIDMLQDQTYTIANYPRLSFGPGQRYASKGCYIVQLSPGNSPEIVRKSDWVVH